MPDDVAGEILAAAREPSALADALAAAGLVTLLHGDLRAGTTAAVLGREQSLYDFKGGGFAAAAGTRQGDRFATGFARS